MPINIPLIENWKIKSDSHQFMLVKTEGDRVFCSYLNDDDLKRDGYFEIADLNENSITLKTKQGLILLPFIRILKIKKSEVENENKYF